MTKQKIDFIVSKIGNKKPQIKFHQHKAGKDGWSEWVYPTQKYLFKCCDCNLIHEMEFGTLLKRNKKGVHFEVIKLPPEIAVMFRARRMKMPKKIKNLTLQANK